MRAEKNELELNVHFKTLKEKTKPYLKMTYFIDKISESEITEKCGQFWINQEVSNYSIQEVYFSSLLSLEQ